MIKFLVVVNVQVFDHWNIVSCYTYMHVMCHVMSRL